MDRHGWAPSVTRTSDAIDLFVPLWRGGHDGDLHVLRLRYCADWQVAGRREMFVNPEDYAEEGRGFWPRGISGINPDHNPEAAICLPGCWGFHSILHPERRDIVEHSLGEILRNLQTMMG